ncbi:ABC transporter substrate-binding protein [Desulfitobacterium sp. THU1]|uniref:ABC transporter substrate-binding protein n=1 Tax=Desulfitobacterium sp. THU1 TaxID=3138072 RepID=UPI00311D5D40
MLKEPLKLISFALLLLSLTFGTIACDTQGSSNTDKLSAPVHLDKVTFNLQWLPEDVAYWVALDKGFWKEQNLDVNIIRGYGSGDTVTKIATKQAEFGIADVGTVILAQARENAPLKAVANFKDSYQGIVMYHDGLGIKSPKDLEGRSIIGAANASNTLFFPAFAKAAGIDQNTIEWKYIDPALQYGAFAQKQADAFTAMVKYIPRVEKLIGKPIAFFSYRDDGKLDRYGETIIVHEDILKENPEMVRRFVAGFLKGLQYSIENPSEVGQIVKKYVPESDPEITVKMWESELNFKAIVGEEQYSNGLGSMSKDRMAKTIKIVLDAYGINKELSPNSVYTTEFLPHEPLFPPKQ